VIRNVMAELLVLRKRASTWILLGIWTTLALVFAYVVPYVTYLNNPAEQPLADVLPQQLVGALMGGFPFFGGVLALMLGVLTFGSEYGWGTLRTLFIQRPGRLRVFAAKLLALAVALVPFVLVVFAVGALASSAIALREGADIALPSAWLVAQGLAAGWLILAVWTALGVLLAVFSRGTALAVGIGILYALVIERLLAGHEARRLCRRRREQRAGVLLRAVRRRRTGAARSRGLRGCLPAGLGLAAPPPRRRLSQHERP
jgi:ABC-2 type transport system permease protein